MSTDYQAWIVVGYRVEQVAVWPFKRRIPEKFHMEDRFDPKTGVPAPSVKVVDSPEKVVFDFAGVAHREFRTFCEAVAKKISCRVDFCHSTESVDHEFAYFCPYPALKEGKYTCLHPHFDIGGPVKFSEVVKLDPEMIRIGMELEQVGIVTEDPVVAMCWRAS